MLQVLFPEKTNLPYLSNNLLQQFPEIVSDPNIHSGWPVIKGTRILATDIFRAQVEEHSAEELILQFKEIGIKHITSNIINEAVRFTLKWMSSLDEKKSQKTSR